VKYILSRTSREVLERFAWSRVLVAFDFDGTLAPIVADRDAARMRAGTRRLFARLCERYPCAVISGRRRDDVAARLGDAAVAHVVGNHGLEPGARLEEFAVAIARIRTTVERDLAPYSGIDVEDKRYSLAIHLRRCRQKQAVRAVIDDAVASMAGVRLIPGKQVVNLVPAGASHKGDALLALRTRADVDTAIYVGDEDTDEDVFALDQPGRLLSIRVGRAARSAAAYYIRDQREVDVLLRSLLEHRVSDLRRSNHVR
jgi:trehalose 6-phosphate phosphatase